MYRRFLQAISAGCLLFAFWPVVRIYNVSAFDCLTPIVIACACLYLPKERGPDLGSFALAIAGLLVLALAGIISLASSFDSIEHIIKVGSLVFALAGMTGLGYVLANRRILTVVQMLYILLLSATVSSAVCILQGQFGMLTNFVADTTNGVETWTRMTGLADHPIEAGDISAFGIVIGIGLAMHTRKWLISIALIAINFYSIKYSASLTAFFAIILASAILCVHTKAYKTLIYGAIVGAAGVAIAFSSGGRLLTSRLEVLTQAQGNYQTIESREMQWRKAIEMIDAGTLLAGNGYSAADLPYKMEIHNGIIASIFHFGLMGLVAQCLLIAYMVTRLRYEAAKPLKGIFIGCLIIFMLSYLTGPALARRSLWVPVILLGAYLTARTDQPESRSTRGLFVNSKIRDVVT